MKTEESENIAQLTGKAVKESKSADIKEGALELQFYGKERSVEDTAAINAAINRIYRSFHWKEKEDIKGKVTDLLGTKDWNMAPGNTAEQVVFQTLRYFMETGGMIKDMIDKEAHEKTQKVMRYIDNVLYVRFKGGEEKIKKALDELNRLNKLLLEKYRKEDVEFSLNDHVLSYSVKPALKINSSSECYYHISADYGNKTRDMTFDHDGRETLDNLNALSDKIRKYIAPKITDVQIILPDSKEYYITAKVNGKPMLRLPITRAEAKAMAEGELDIRAVAERKYARQIELAEKKGNGMKR